MREANAVVHDYMGIQCVALGTSREVKLVELLVTFILSRNQLSYAIFCGTTPLSTMDVA